jgi:hypothetical protein
MTYLTRLTAAIKQELEQGRLGTPVYVRLVIVASSDHGHLVPVSVAGIQLIQELLGPAIDEIFVAGSVESGNLSLQLHLEGGRTGQVVVILKREGPPGADLLLVGNHGTLRHDLAEAGLAGETEERLWSTDSSAVRGELVEAVEESLRKRLPVRVG